MPTIQLSLIARGIFVLLATAMGAVAGIGLSLNSFQGAIGGAFFGVAVVLIDMGLKNITFKKFSHATIGLLVGLFCGSLIHHVVQRLFGLIDFSPSVLDVLQVGIHMAFGYWGMSLAMRANRQEFSVILPYVRFRQDSAQDSPLLVDTNIIIDGRIAKLCETGFISGDLVVPRFVLDELHLLADSPDSIKSSRGKRGLEALKEMQDSPLLEVTIQEDFRGDKDTTTDTKLIQMARNLGARMLTNDANLGNVAQLQGVTILNLNRLAQAMRPSVMPGDLMQIRLVKEGRDSHQAVGYLDDGTMIVVNNAARHLGEIVDIVIVSPLQTSAGRLIFAELQQSQSGPSKIS